VSGALGFAQTGSGSGCFDGNLGQCLKDVLQMPGTASGTTPPSKTLSSGVGSAVSDVANSAWNGICHSFADALTSVLQWFGGVFASMPDPDLASIRGVYGISLTLGMLVATFLLVLQAGSVVWTRSGAPLVQALTGLPKAALAAVCTLAVASQIMAASDALAQWIVTASGTSMAGFTRRLTSLLALSALADPAGGEVPAVLLLVFGLVGIVLVVTLWFELVLRNAVFCVIVASAPISAAGQIGGSTQEWWRKLVKAGIQLALLKPVIALVFVIGFDMAGNSTGITGLVSGMAVLAMAVFAWPVVARFFTFTSSAIGGAMGVGALVGAVANRSAGGGSGIDPGAFGKFSENQAMSANAARGGGSAGSAGSQAAAGASATAGGGAAGGAAKAAAGAAAGPAGFALAAVQTLHKTINAVASRMEQQAGNAGMDGANPTAYPGGFPSYGPVRMPKHGPDQSSKPSGTGGGSAPSAGPATGAGA
jgi:hypothetical protein